MTDEGVTGRPGGSGEDRRRFMKKAAVAGAVAVPTVMSFSMDGVLIQQVTASAAGSVPPPPLGPNVIKDPGFDI